MNERRENAENKRQIDPIQNSLKYLVKVIDGEGQELGIKAKVNIMWGYRILFVSAISANLIAIIIFLLKGGGHG